MIYDTKQTIVCFPQEYFYVYATSVTMKKEITKENSDRTDNNHGMLDDIVDGRKAAIKVTFQDEINTVDSHVDTSRLPFTTLSSKDEIALLKK
ncbi:MAG: hypothetical protein WCL18_07605 [bacterium]